MLLGVRVAQVASVGLAALVFLYWARQLLDVDVVEQMESGVLSPGEAGPDE